MNTVTSRVWVKTLDFVEKLLSPGRSAHFDASHSPPLNRRAAYRKFPGKTSAQSLSILVLRAHSFFSTKPRAWLISSGRAPRVTQKTTRTLIRYRRLHNRELASVYFLRFDLRSLHDGQCELSFGRCAFTLLDPAPKCASAIACNASTTIAHKRAQ
jgi:hypothetical protein